MNNGQMDRGDENPTQAFALMIEENHEKNPSQVGQHRDLNQGPPLVRYHGATSLCYFNLLRNTCNISKNMLP